MIYNGIFVFCRQIRGFEFDGRIIECRKKATKCLSNHDGGIMIANMIAQLH